MDEELFANAPVVPLPELPLALGMVFARSNLVWSLSQYRRAVAEGRVFINGLLVEDAERMVTQEDLTPKGELLLQVGKHSRVRMVGKP